MFSAPWTSAAIANTERGGGLPGDGQDERSTEQARGEPAVEGEMCGHRQAATLRRRRREGQPRDEGAHDHRSNEAGGAEAEQNGAAITAMPAASSSRAWVGEGDESEGGHSDWNIG